MKRLEWIDPLSGKVCKMPEPREIVRHGEGLARGFSRGADGKLTFVPAYYTVVESPAAAENTTPVFGLLTGLPPGWYLVRGTELPEARWWSGQGLSGWQYLTTVKHRKFLPPTETFANVDYWNPINDAPDVWARKLSRMTTLRITE